MKRVAIALITGILLLSSTATAGQSIRNLAIEEKQNLEQQGFNLPEHGIFVSNWWHTLGFIITAEKPYRYYIALRSWYYSEGQARAVYVHEAAHMLANERHATYEDEETEERTMDSFAACFGTPQAQQWARRMWVNPDKDTCTTLKRQFNPS